MTLPLWLDRPQLRVVHACWHEELRVGLSRRVRASNLLDEPALQEAHTKGTATHRAVDVLLKGLEIPLPAGATFHYKDGHERDAARVRWWDQSASTFRAALLAGCETSKQIPDSPIPDK